MDIELCPDRPLFVITGPNACGKTIALKTLAVQALMAQVGCHVPADEGSRLPVFDDVFAIIGDDQSVAENLSTFSAFVKQAREILERADQRSLVLLDELGAGTDPAERANEIERIRAEAAAQLAKARQSAAAAESRAQAIVARARAEATALVGEIRRALTAEWDKLKRSDRSRRSLDESRRRVREVAGRMEALVPEAPVERPVALAPGATVAAEHLGISGELVEITGSSATVRSGAVTVRVPLSVLRPAPTHPAATGRGAGVREPRDPSHTPAPRPVAAEILLLGHTSDEARDRVEKYLDDAFLAGLASVRLIHGKGSGALRKAVRDLLAGHPLVESFRDGEPSEGGTGATVAALKVG